MGAGKAADLTYWEGAARMIASVSTTSKIVVEKSTVPVKTAEAIEKVLLLPSSVTTCFQTSFISVTSSTFAGGETSLVGFSNTLLSSVSASSVMFKAVRGGEASLIRFNDI